MTWSPAVSGAAPRALRAAAGRRAVQLALLVGAVFVLGVLCGERAQAADGVPVRESSAAGAPVATGPRTPSGGNAPGSLVDALTVPRPEAADPVRPLTGTAVRSVEERVVRPAGELVGAVTGGLDEASGALPALPALPAPPGPEQPVPLPDVPVLPEAPAQTLPEPAVPGPDQPSSPSPAGPAVPTPGAPGAPGAPSAAEAAGTPGTSSSVPDGPARAADPALHGPRLTGVGSGTHGRPGDQGGRGRGAVARDDVPAGPVLAPYAPAGGRPDGATGTGSVTDHGTPRHGDACAVPAFHRPAPRLVPGPAAPAETAGTRDRCRDVPVSPA
ncbi:hypothetical protein ACFVZC_10695 [Streptomyces marokkonensis]|uniref:Secreted protein n=1 Tax=Streptomyces marokkonensis TaxID=324855 RepID=A0ABW6Q3R9_9ACTN